VARDDLHPRGKLALSPRRRLGEEDLHRTLIGVIGIVRADGVAAGGPAKDRLTRGEEGQEV